MEIITWCVTCTVLAAGTVYIVRKRRQQFEPRQCGKDYPADTVILHQFPRGPRAPSMSGFCLKLETFLRMTNIPYKNELGYKTGPKDKSPWIEYNGATMGDSQMIMEYLSEKCQVDLDKHLSDHQKALGRAIRVLAEDHMYWLVLLERWVYHRAETKAEKLTKLPSLFVWEIGRRTNNQAHAQGLGRHTQPEVERLLREDLKAISDFLGDKKFLFGDDACAVDCAVFGQLCQVMWHIPSVVTAKAYLEESLPNLKSYVERMRTAYWPDWDECVTDCFTKEATK
ncbi:failed axon connections homolog isoform X1 [Dreissena polymorpha]|nr:failed axon connections homolog isoform X1 [Dreissena polymorpha]